MSQRLILIATLTALALATTTLARQGVTDPGVEKRSTNMTSARTALESLGNMVTGKTGFDRQQARQARRVLIDSTGKIPRLFRKPHTDPKSRARPAIWTQWDDFTSRAKTARKAARKLDASSLADLRASLAPMLKACLNCHEIYRTDNG